MPKIIKKLKPFFLNKKILVTGGTGSIGEKIVTSLLKYDPEQIVVFSRDDSKQYMMEKKYAKFNNIYYFLGDIRDYSSVEYITRGIDIVFHAAALKQVPVCEENPFEAVKTNVLGSENLIKASILNNVKKVINISTDKAVNPTSTMGVTKLLSEKLFYKANFLKNNLSTTFSSVRFGNVIGSRGSVIPIFLEQVKAEKELTITDPKMTRFFMTIPDAVDLTLKAAYYSLGGETFIFKMKAAQLDSLTDAIKIYSKEKGLKTPTVKIVGARQGEKFYEELISDNEMDHVVEDEELYVILPNKNSNPYWHFNKTNVNSYRSDQVNKFSLKEMVSLLYEIEING